MKCPRSALGNYDPYGPGTVRAADQRAKVSGVLKTVSYHKASRCAHGDFRHSPRAWPSDRGEAVWAVTVDHPPQYLFADLQGDGLVQAIEQPVDFVAP
jgi:hypothetical protein